LTAWAKSRKALRYFISCGRRLCPPYGCADFGRCRDRSPFAFRIFLIVRL